MCYYHQFHEYGDCNVVRSLKSLHARALLKAICLQHESCKGIWHCHPASISEVSPDPDGTGAYDSWLYHELQEARTWCSSDSCESTNMFVFCHHYLLCGIQCSVRWFLKGNLLSHELSADELLQGMLHRRRRMIWKQPVTRCASKPHVLPSLIHEKTDHYGKLTTIDMLSFDHSKPYSRIRMIPISNLLFGTTDPHFNLAPHCKYTLRLQAFTIHPMQLGAML